jgi:hypothetical protein
MKSKKFFEISYLLNFILSLAFIFLIFYATIIERASSEENFSILLLFFAVFLLIVVPFNWICYSLHKTYKTSQQLSKKARIGGTIFYILFSLLTILEIIGFADILTDLVTSTSIRQMRFVLFALLFGSMTITGVSLCINYWFIRRQTRVHFVDVIAQLGDETIL